LEDRRRIDGPLGLLEEKFVFTATTRACCAYTYPTNPDEWDTPAGRRDEADRDDEDDEED
jgi:hypothetical protein